MKKFIFILICIIPVLAWSQAKRIEVINADINNIDKEEFPNATIHLGNVVIVHEGMTLRCKKAVFYERSNFIQAYGEVNLDQGDTITMTSKYVEYDGNIKRAKSWGDVILKDPLMTLTTDTLYFNRTKQLLYYQDGATIKDSTNVLESRKGNYYLESTKFQALSEVVITNPDYVLKSNHLDYYTSNGHANLYGPSTIIGEDNYIYTEDGFYDTKNGISHFIRPSKIIYKGREITADSLYYDRNIGFASAVDHIQLLDTANNSVIRGNYAEVFQKSDSAYVVGRAVAISEIEKDSLYIHGDTLMVTGKKDERILRAFHRVKFFKTDLSGKCDSIYSNQTTGLTKMFQDPVIWSEENQVTGDTIYLQGNNETEKLDSIKVLQNAFIIQKDSTGNLNQIKGRNILGKIIDNQLNEVMVIGNSEVIFFIRDEEKDELIGINKRNASYMQFLFENGDIKTAHFFVSPEGFTYPPSQLPVAERTFPGAVWRIDEKPMKVEDIFTKDNEPIPIEDKEKVNATESAAVRQKE